MIHLWIPKFFIIVQALISYAYCDGIWREDLSNRINIGAPTDGYHRVQLNCNDNSISVAVVTENDFDGVIYTRGSFYGRSEKCFQEGRFGQTDYYFDFEFDECNVKKKDKNTYTVTLVIQNDKELIMPGDSAFKLVCDFRSREKNT
uniref:Zona pellucida-like domain-containing protein n=1 Tax=Artemia franciscana TaxID=6661 RepID=A7XAK7_ARTSF|nr:zona pellucida-like domain-containing protein [Artemia franciscana]